MLGVPVGAVGLLGAFFLYRFTIGKKDYEA